jgi:hypothetical protein
MADRFFHEVACDLSYRFLGGLHHERLIFDVKRERNVRVDARWASGSVARGTRSAASNTSN